MAIASFDGFSMSFEVHEGLFPADTLFIHGNLSSNAWWRPSLAAWRKKAKPGYQGRAICAEWRGCGQSSAPVAGPELHPEALAHDYLALLDRLGVACANVVGHSTGGLIALYAMAAEPRRFARAVLLDSVSHRGVEFVPEAIDAFAQMSQNRVVCQAVMATTIHGADTKSPFFQEIVDIALGVAPLIWTAVPTVLGSIDAREVVARVPHPTLALHGELDPILPIEGSMALARRLPHGSFFAIKGHGHSTNVEDPELFAQLAGAHLFTDIEQGESVALGH
jgi:pimeloyl-ACP methyl ester carboxylesterase